jgi:ABC-2 type transport system ATP-binding protein
MKNISNIVEVENLHKVFVAAKPLHKQFITPLERGVRVDAIKDVSFAIKSGQILGIVGPNGAGKTTMLRIMADLLEPTTGVVRLCGKVLNTANRDLCRRIGYVSSDERSFFWRLTGRENLEFFGRLYGLSSKEARTRTQELITEFSFAAKADQLFRDYSAGMRRKIAIMRALVHLPAVLLFDEATNSLDPQSAAMVKRAVRAYVSNTKSCAAAWSTHRLEEISEICDRVITIDAGMICYDGKIHDFCIKNQPYSDYVLKAMNLNGSFEPFRQRVSPSIHTDASQNGDVAEFVFHQISGQQFAHIVTMAVKEYEAYIMFAGCIQKQPVLIGK